MSETPTPAPDPKPGWKTTEFWLTLLAAVLSVLIQFDILPTEGDGWMAKVVSAAVLALGAAGYAVSRGMAKSGRVGMLLLAGGAMLLLGGCNGGSLDLEAHAVIHEPDPSLASAVATSLPLVAAPGKKVVSVPDCCRPVAVSAPVRFVPERVSYRVPTVAVPSYRYVVPAAPSYRVAAPSLEQPRRSVVDPPGERRRPSDCPPCPECPDCPDCD